MWISHFRYSFWIWMQKNVISTCKWGLWFGMILCQLRVKMLLFKSIHPFHWSHLLYIEILTFSQTCLLEPFSSPHTLFLRLQDIQNLFTDKRKQLVFLNIWWKINILQITMLMAESTTFGKHPYVQIISLLKWNDCVIFLSFWHYVLIKVWISAWFYVILEFDTLVDWTICCLNFCESLFLGPVCRWSL